MSAERIKCVLLADRHHGLSEGLRSLLETIFEAVVMVADEHSLFETARRLRPTLAVVDLPWPWREPPVVGATPGNVPGSEDHGAERPRRTERAGGRLAGRRMHSSSNAPWRRTCYPPSMPF